MRVRAEVIPMGHEGVEVVRRSLVIVRYYWLNVNLPPSTHYLRRARCAE